MRFLLYLAKEVLPQTLSVSLHVPQIVDLPDLAAVQLIDDMGRKLDVLAGGVDAMEWLSRRTGDNGMGGDSLLLFVDDDLFQAKLLILDVCRSLFEEDQ